MGVLLFILAAAPVVPLDQWQHRWGDDPAWATDAWDAPGWAPTRVPGQPPKNATHEAFLWMRTKLPEGAWRAPALKLDGVVGHFELFLDGAPLYVFPEGGLNAKGAHGMPWHLVALPPDAGGKTLSLRSRTSYFLAGIVGTASVGERSVLVEDVIRRDLPRAVVGVLLVVFGLLALLILIPAGAKRLATGLALFTIPAGVYTLNYTQLKQLAVDVPPVAWFLAWIGAVALMPIGTLRYISAVFAEQPRHLVRFRRAHEVAGGLYVLASLAAWGALELWGPPAERAGTTAFIVTGAAVRLLILASNTAVLWHIVQIARRGPPAEQARARILLLGVGAMFAVTLGALGASFGVSRYGAASEVYLGLLVLTLAFAVVAGRAWSEAQQQAIAFAGQLADASKEKESMLRDLHDGIGGVTTNIRLLAELGMRDGQKAAGALNTIAELSTEGLAELRAFIQTMEDTSATWSILCSELRRYGGQMIESQGKTFAMTAELKEDGKPGSALSLAVLRVFREALTNVVKHAGATRVDVAVAVGDGRFALSISDDGTGSGPGGGLDTGRGVANMRARAKDLGGTLTLTAGPGTHVRLELPIPRNPPGAQG